MTPGTKGITGPLMTCCSRYNQILYVVIFHAGVFKVNLYKVRLDAWVYSMYDVILSERDITEPHMTSYLV